MVTHRVPLVLSITGLCVTIFDLMTGGSFLASSIIVGLLLLGFRNHLEQKSMDTFAFPTYNFLHKRSELDRTNR